MGNYPSSSVSAAVGSLASRNKRIKKKKNQFSINVADNLTDLHAQFLLQTCGNKYFDFERVGIRIKVGVM